MTSPLDTLPFKMQVLRWREQKIWKDKGWFDGFYWGMWTTGVAIMIGTFFTPGETRWLLWVVSLGVWGASILIFALDNYWSREKRVPMPFRREPEVKIEDVDATWFWGSFDG